MQIKDFIPQAPDANVGAHIMCWFDGAGGNGHMNPGYASTDPAIISLQADLMQELGISWINIDLYVTEHTTMTAAGLWLAECEKRGMKFSVCMDGPSKASTQQMISDLQSLSLWFNSSAYKRNAQGKLQVSDFDASAIDWNAVQAQFPNIEFLHLHSGFAWVEASMGTGAISYLAQLNKSIGPNGWQAIFSGFHDYNWGKGPERFVDYRNGQTWLDTCATVTPDCQDLLLVTWNDYDERTGMERNFDEALNAPPRIQWPAPIIGQYQWPLPLGSVLDPASTGIPTTNPTPGGSMRVFLIVLENTNYVDVQSHFPYLWSQAQKYDLKSNYYANYHPSMGDYLMLTTGRADSTDDAFNGTISDPTIVSVLAKSGKKAAAYAESLTSQRNFYKRHVPFMYFASNPTVKDFSQFAADLASGQLADFVMITPNGMNDAHDGTPAQADAWLKQNIDQLWSQPNSYVIVLFDESANDNTNGGGKVFAMEGGTLARQGFDDSSSWNHYDMYNHIVQLLTLTPAPAPTPTPAPAPAPTPSPSPAPAPNPDIAALQAAVSSLQTSVTSLSTSLSSLGARVSAIENKLSSVKAQL